MLREESFVVTTDTCVCFVEETFWDALPEDSVSMVETMGIGMCRSEGAIASVLIFAVVEKLESLRSKQQI